MKLQLLSEFKMKMAKLFTVKSSIVTIKWKQLVKSRCLKLGMPGARIYFGKFQTDEKQ